MTPTLSPAEVGDALGQSAAWVTNAARSGLLPGRKVGRSWRFTESDVDAYLERVKTGTKVAAVTPRRRRRAA